MNDDALKYRQHAEKIRRLVASVRGHAATAALLLADEYDMRADQLDGQPASATYIAQADRVGELIATEREAITALNRSETSLIAELAALRQQRLIAETRVEAILHTARLFDAPKVPRTGAAPQSFREAANEAGPEALRPADNHPPAPASERNYAHPAH